MSTPDKKTVYHTEVQKQRVYFKGQGQGVVRGRIIQGTVTVPTEGREVFVELRAGRPFRQVSTQFICVSLNGRPEKEQSDRCCRAVPGSSEGLFYKNTDLNYPRTDQNKNHTRKPSRELHTADAPTR